MLRLWPPWWPIRLRSRKDWRTRGPETWTTTASSTHFPAWSARSPHRQTRMEKWSKSKGEWIGRSGWQLLAHLAMNDTGLPDSYFESHLATIEKEVHTRKNRVRDAMNSALIAIGIRNPEAGEKGAGRRKTNREDRGRPRRNQLQDAGRRLLHPQDTREKTRKACELTIPERSKRTLSVSRPWSP